MTHEKDTLRSIADDTVHAFVASAFITKQQLELGASDTPLTTAFEIAASLIDQAQIPGRLMAQGKAIAAQGDEAAATLKQRVAQTKLIFAEAFDELEPEEQEQIMEFLDGVKEKFASKFGGPSL